jgi:hypothetical protein
VLRKPYAPAFGFKNTHLFPLRVPRRGNSFAFPLPTLALLRLRLSASPSRAGPSLLPCDQGGIPPLQPPLICVHLEGHKSGKRFSVSGSTLLSDGEEPCPLRLQTVFFTHKPSQNRGLISLGQSLRVFDALSLIYKLILLLRRRDALINTRRQTKKRTRKKV